jgi:NitT/TauT family transport system substrate-binding protein
MARAQKALATSSAADVAQAVAPFLPALAPEALTRMVHSYRLHGLWATQPDLPASAFLRLKAALVSGGLIQRDPSYTQVVDETLSLTP